MCNGRCAAHDDGPHALPEGSGSFSISRALVALAALAIQARDPTRFDLLYRLVWRANAGERVLGKTTDPEVTARACPCLRGPRRGAQDAHFGALPAGA